MMDGNKEIVKPVTFESSKPRILHFTPIPKGYQSLDDFEMNATFPIIVFYSSKEKTEVDKKRLPDKGDSCIVGDLGD